MAIFTTRNFSGPNASRLARPSNRNHCWASNGARFSESARIDWPCMILAIRAHSGMAQMTTKRFSVGYGVVKPGVTTPLKSKSFKTEDEARKWAAIALLKGAANYVHLGKNEKRAGQRLHPRPLGTSRMLSRYSLFRPLDPS